MTAKIEKCIGKVYNFLRVVEDLGYLEYGNKGRKARFVIAECLKCGVVRKKYDLTRLRCLAIKSCGCLHKELLSKRRKTHGMTGSQTYQAWFAMKFRCYNPKFIGFKDYGGRGISVCDSWLESFENFLKDMGEAPLGTSLDRIDVNGNYGPENCRWASRSDQAYNKRIEAKNTSGRTGVAFHKHTNKWRVTISVNRKQISKGYFNNFEDAVAAREKAEIEVYGYTKA